MESIPIDRHSAVPLHEQIGAALRERIASGALLPGSRLPASRDLARRLGVNRGAVQKAYDALVAAGAAWARVGQGTFIAGTPPPAAGGAPDSTPPVPFLFDPRALEDPGWERLARWSARHGVISLAGGIPDARLFPVQAFKGCLDAALDEEGMALLQYGAARGYPPFLDFLSTHLRRRGLPVPPERILVVSGSQQGLDLIARVFLSPGDAVVVEDPTYSGALALFRMLGVRLLPVPVDEDGMDVEHLAGLLARERPRLLYTVPTFHNPTGQTLSWERRTRLLGLCGAAGVPVVEDDSDGELRFEGKPMPPLAAMPSRRGVIYIGTFSKLFFPGLRLGWVAGDTPVIQRLEATKRVADLHTPPLLQAAMARFATASDYAAFADRVRARYRDRRDVMLAALEEHMPEGVTWTRPRGGLSLMLDLPVGIDAADLLPRAVDRGVAFAPGPLFSPSGGGRHRLRLTYGNVREEDIRSGVQRLAVALDEEVRSRGPQEEERLAMATPPPV